MANDCVACDESRCTNSYGTLSRLRPLEKGAHSNPAANSRDCAGSSEPARRPGPSCAAHRLSHRPPLVGRRAGLSVDGASGQVEQGARDEGGDVPADMEQAVTAYGENLIL